MGVRVFKLVEVDNSKVGQIYDQCKYIKVCSNLKLIQNSQSIRFRFS